MQLNSAPLCDSALALDCGGYKWQQLYGTSDQEDGALSTITPPPGFRHRASSHSDSDCRNSRWIPVDQPSVPTSSPSYTHLLLRRSSVRVRDLDLPPRPSHSKISRSLWTHLRACVRPYLLRASTYLYLLRASTYRSEVSGGCVPWLNCSNLGLSRGFRVMKSQCGSSRVTPSQMHGNVPRRRGVFLNGIQHKIA